MKTYPPVVVVNDQDEVIGEAPLAVAREQNMIYRIVFVIIMDTQGRILLQRRAKEVTLFPDCWDISAGGHVDDGRNYKQAAEAELAEELGLEALALTEAAHFYTETPALNGQHARRYVTIFNAVHDVLPQNLGLEEVSGVQWFTMEEIKELVESQPELVAEGLQHAYAYVLAKT